MTSKYPRLDKSDGLKNYTDQKLPRREVRNTTKKSGSQVGLFVTQKTYTRQVSVSSSHNKILRSVHETFKNCNSTIQEKILNRVERHSAIGLQQLAHARACGEGSPSIPPRGAQICGNGSDPGGLSAQVMEELSKLSRCAESLSLTTEGTSGVCAVQD